MKKRLFRAAAVLMALLLLPACLCAAEEALPPSPEPPAGTIGRPTPAPTAVPTDIIIDQVHYPEQYPGFTFQPGKKILDIWIPNIKDADEAILIYDGTVWMIDCGDEKAGARGARLIRQLGIKNVDVLFNTHPHHDHINGLAQTCGATRVGEIRICFSPVLTESGLNMIQTAMDLKIPVKEYKDGDSFSMGDGEVRMQVYKNNEEHLDMNSQSAQMMITYGERSILFTADMEQPGQEALLKRVGPEALKCDILKYPHHAKSGLFPDYYEALQARLAVVTSFEGRGDSGQRFLSNRHLPAVYTSVNDKFTHLATDGAYWLCEQVPITAE